MKFRNVITITLALILFLLPLKTYASEIKENSFSKEPTQTAPDKTGSVFDEYIDAEPQNITKATATINRINDVQFICDEIKNKTILKNMLENRNVVAELAVKATNVSMIHKSYIPAAKKAEALNKNLSDIDICINEYAKIMQTQTHQVIFQINEPQNNNANVILRQIEILKKEINSIKDQSEQIDLHVDCFYGFHDLPQIRKDLVNTAFLLKGQISYEWGSKPVNAGWNKRWNTKGTGLDCSGFIEWVYWTVTGNSNEALRSTLIITDTQEQITYEELLPGDLGTILTEGSYYIDYAGNKYYNEDAAKKANEEAGYSADDIVTYSNHVGIYVGKDAKGNDIWCHCQGGDVKTVTVGPFEKFVNYYRMPNIE